MNANELNKRVAIYKFTRTINDAGTPIENFALYKYTYASIKVAGGGKHSNDPEGELPYTNVNINMRYEPELDYNCEIRYNDQTYKISYIELDERKRFHKLKCVTYNEFL
jgi:head-tail adaptor